MKHAAHCWPWLSTYVVRIACLVIALSPPWQQSTAARITTRGVLPSRVGDRSSARCVSSIVQKKCQLHFFSNTCGTPLWVRFTFVSASLCTYPLLCTSSSYAVPVSYTGDQQAEARCPAMPEDTCADALDEQGAKNRGGGRREEVGES